MALKPRAIETLGLWRAVRPYLPDSIKDARIRRLSVKFTLTKRGGTTASCAATVAVGEGYDYREESRRGPVADPYALYKVLAQSISNLPTNAQKLELVLDPNKGHHIKATVTPIVAKETGSNGAGS